MNTVRRLAGEIINNAITHHQSQNIIKDPHWYDVQVSDTTMMTMPPSARTIAS